MSDLSATIAAKSDQLTADDLIGGPRTIRIASVEVAVDAEQPVTLRFEGDEGRGYRPCKIMRRALVQCWGPDGAQYAGRAMTVYRDPDVMFGAVKTGGIRISHLSDIAEPVTLALMVKKGQRKPFRVLPLPREAPQPDPAESRILDGVRELIERIEDARTLDALTAVTTAAAKQRAWLAEHRPDEAQRVDAAIEAAQARVVGGGE